MIDHYILLVLTITGQVSLAAFTSTIEECEAVRQSTRATIDQHNKDRPKGYSRVDVVLVCTGIERK